MGFLKKYFIRYRKNIFLGQAFKLVEAVLELYMPLVMAALIDQGVTGHDQTVIWQKGLLMLGIAALGVCAALVCQVTASRASQDFGTALRHDLFAHILSLSRAEGDGVGPAALMTRMTSDINQLQQALAMLIRLVVRAPFLAIGSIVMAVVLSPRLSLIFLVTTPLIALAMFFIMRRTLPHYKTLQRKLDRIARITRENLEGVRVVRAFARGDAEKARFEAASGDYTDTAVRVGKLSALLSPLTSAVMYMGIAAVLYFGGGQVHTGALTQGVVIAFISYLMQILLQMSVVANLVVVFTKAGASAQRVGELMALAPSVQEPSGDETPDPAAPAVQFDHVTFSYPGGGDAALRDVTFTLLPGETLGVIGGTGAGKTTLSALIGRDYDVTAGTVSVCGHDVRAYRQRTLRGLIGLTPQGGQLLSGTVRSNLLFSKPDASEADMWAALEAAQAREFVEKKPEGLDAPVEEGGKNLSGGQRQRLTVARALVRAPRVLILDDASSALDYMTDLKMRQAIARQDRETGRATVIISQRVSAVRHADRILVLDDGCQAGLGTHGELTESCPVYREICQSQQVEKEAAQA